MSDTRYLSLAVDPIADDAPEGIIEGYASVFNVAYPNAMQGSKYPKEIILAGAFTDSLDGDGGRMPLFYEHDWKAGPIGYVEASQDSSGVRVRATVFMDDPRARSIWLAAKAGALREWSLGYRADESRAASADPLLEEVVRGTIYESSIVVKGANPGTFMTKVASAADVEDDASDDAKVEQIKNLLAQLIQSEAAELEAGEGGTSPIAALVSVLQELGWYESADEYDDASHSDDVSNSFASLLDDPEATMRALRDPAMRAIIRETIQDPSKDGAASK